MLLHMKHIYCMHICSTYKYTVKLGSAVYVNGVHREAYSKSKASEDLKDLQRFRYM